MPGVPVLFVDGVKPCSICGEKKPPEEFNRDSKSASGYASRCKACQRLYRLKRGETIHELRERRVAVRIEETKARRAEREAERERKRQEREEAGLAETGRVPVLFDAEGLKPCSICRERLPREAFWKDRSTKSGHSVRCKECSKRYQMSRDQRRHYNLAYKYGITVERFDEMYHEQGGKCAICSETLDLEAKHEGAAVDHCHSTGRVRGILCAQCNRGLGMFLDDESYLLAAIEYLRKNRD